MTWILIVLFWRTAGGTEPALAVDHISGFHSLEECKAAGKDAAAMTNGFSLNSASFTCVRQTSP